MKYKRADWTLQPFCSVETVKNSNVTVTDAEVQKQNRTKGCRGRLQNGQNWPETWSASGGAISASRADDIPARSKQHNTIMDRTGYAYVQRPVTFRSASAKTAKSKHVRLVLLMLLASGDTTVSIWTTEVDLKVVHGWKLLSWGIFLFFFFGKGIILLFQFSCQENRKKNRFFPFLTGLHLDFI